MRALRTSVLLIVQLVLVFSGAAIALAQSEATPLVPNPPATADAVPPATAEVEVSPETSEPAPTEFPSATDQTSPGTSPTATIPALTPTVEIPLEKAPAPTATISPVPPMTYLASGNIVVTSQQNCAAATVSSSGYSGSETIHITLWSFDETVSQEFVIPANSTQTVALPNGVTWSRTIQQAYRADGQPIGVNTASACVVTKLPWIDLAAVDCSSAVVRGGNFGTWYTYNGVVTYTDVNGASLGTETLTIPATNTLTATLHPPAGTTNVSVTGWTATDPTTGTVYPITKSSLNAAVSLPACPAPTPEPTQTPTPEPTVLPTEPVTPTPEPTALPTEPPTPTQEPTVLPTEPASSTPTVEPTIVPTQPITPTPTVAPTVLPEDPVTPTPTTSATVIPTLQPTVLPTGPVTPTPTYEAHIPEDPSIVTPTPEMTPTPAPTVLPSGPVTPTLAATVSPMTPAPTVLPTGPVTPSATVQPPSSVSTIPTGTVSPTATTTAAGSSPAANMRRSSANGQSGTVSSLPVTGSGNHASTGPIIFTAACLATLIASAGIRRRNA